MHETTTAPHTGMQMPHTHIRVTDLAEVDIGRGIAWSARLCEDTTLLGTISNAGQGGPTEFTPTSRQARRVLDDFVAQCRDGQGEPLHEESVLDTLTDEYDYANQVVQAEREHTYLVRGFDRSGIPDLTAVRPAPGASFDLADAHATARRLRLKPRIVRAEVWTGQSWEEFYRCE